MENWVLFGFFVLFLCLFLVFYIFQSEGSSFHYTVCYIWFLVSTHSEIHKNKCVDMVVESDSRVGLRIQNEKNILLLYFMIWTIYFILSLIQNILFYQLLWAHPAPNPRSPPVSKCQNLADPPPSPQSGWRHKWTVPIELLRN